jgi:hypothetical protein
MLLEGFVRKLDIGVDKAEDVLLANAPQSSKAKRQTKRYLPLRDPSQISPREESR